MIARDCFLLALVLCFACCACESSKKESKDEILQRHKRVIPWLQTAGCGVSMVFDIKAEKWLSGGAQITVLVGVHGTN